MKKIIQRLDWDWTQTRPRLDLDFRPRHLDFRCNCTTESVIYLYVCKLCTSNDSFYVGQTVNSARDRANGHRSKFTSKAYTKSALSHHIYVDHPEHFHKKLLNFDLGVITSTAATNLDRKEDYYVELTKADLSLNRYKVVSWLWLLPYGFISTVLFLSVL